MTGERSPLLADGRDGSGDLYQVDDERFTVPVPHQGSLYTDMKDR